MWALIQRTLKISVRPKFYNNNNNFIKKLHKATALCSRKDKSNAFTNEEEAFIVDVINKCSPEDYEKYDIHERHVKKFENYKESHGKFETFDDVLISQDVPVIIRISRSILAGGKKQKIQKFVVQANKVIPAVNDDIAKEIKSIVGLSVCGDIISWAMFEESKLSHWNRQTYSNPSKSSLVPLINNIIRITTNMPHADAYVMEADLNKSLGKLKTAGYAIHLQRQQVITAIISILGMRRRFNECEYPAINNFFTLQPLCSAKAFGLSIGNETVVSDMVIDDILGGNVAKYLPKLGSITVDSAISNDYLFKSPGRVQFHSALLITLAFADIIKGIVSKDSNKPQDSSLEKEIKL